MRGNTEGGGASHHLPGSTRRSRARYSDTCGQRQSTAQPNVVQPQRPCSSWAGTQLGSGLAAAPTALPRFWRKQ